MAIRRDLRDLPDPGAPDPEPRFFPVLAETWRAENEDEHAAHVPSGKAFVHSDGGNCARAIAYRAAKIPRSDPMDLTGHWNTRLGKMIHQEWQRATAAQFGHQAEVEVEVGFEEIDSVGFIDVLLHLADYPDPNVTIVSIEGKSIGGYGHKAAVGAIRKSTPPEGPKWGHKVQAALNALAADADEAVVSYFAKECISYQDWDPVDRIGAEWTMTRDEFEPIARDEIALVRGILDLVEKGELAARKIPGVPGEIVNASTGEWRRFDRDEVLVDTGTTWQCRYCAWQKTCAQTPPGRVPVEQVVEIANKEKAA